MLNKAAPTRIGGRFQVVRTLGKGGQGEVYLAQDTQLKRRVAIKTLTLKSIQSDQRESKVKALLDEALIVGQLAHPNIVTLYDAGLEGEMPWLVFEYVEGKPLSALIKEAGRLPVARAVDIAIQVLKAVGFAHGKGVVHRDLKPANVMITEGETARVMDFGIAQLLQSQPQADASFVGTPAYMAPEYIGGTAFTARSDVFSAGMLLYEMLTGTPAATGQNPYEIMNKVAHEPFAPPSWANPDIDERLDHLVLKALAKDPSERFDSAAALEDALYRYLSPELVAAPEGSQQGTLEFLLRRMRYKSDFPALSSTMTAVNRSAASETERVARLSSSILKDFALTNKLLKLVNSAHYKQFGNISTVSRAVVIMGFDNVRNVAITLMLFEHLQNKAQAAQLKDEILATYFSGLVARELTSKAGIKDPEEAFICSMFHKLGRLLTTFYFHDEYQEIQKRCKEPGLHEEVAAAQVLGISYEALGLGIAKAWNFPDRLTSSLRRVEEEKASKPQNDEQRLCVLSELASGVTDAVRETDPARRRARLSSLAAQFGESLGVTETMLTDATRAAAEGLSRDSGLLNFKPAGPLYASLQDLAKPGRGQAAPAQTADALESVVSRATLQDTVPATAKGGGAVAPADAQAILTAGIQDITNTLVGDYKLNDVLRIILETMYRGMGFTRVLLCIRDPAINALQARFGFGQDIDQIIKRGFNIPLTPTRDAFYAAISQGADICIEDVNADSIREHIPGWYRKLVPARSLVLFPILINKKPVGLFYADCDTPGSIRFEATELSLLKTLRNQAVIAIKTQS